MRDEDLREDLDYAMDWELWLRLASKGWQFRHYRRFVAGVTVHKDRKIICGRESLEREQAFVRELFQQSSGVRGTWSRLRDLVISAIQRVQGVMWGLIINTKSNGFIGAAKGGWIGFALRQILRRNKDLA